MLKFITGTSGERSRIRKRKAPRARSWLPHVELTASRAYSIINTFTWSGFKLANRNKYLILFFGSVGNEKANSNHPAAFRCRYFKCSRTNYLPLQPFESKKRDRTFLYIKFQIFFFLISVACLCFTVLLK